MKVPLIASKADNPLYAHLRLEAARESSYHRIWGPACRFVAVCRSKNQLCSPALRPTRTALSSRCGELSRRRQL